MQIFILFNVFTETKIKIKKYQEDYKTLGKSYFYSIMTTAISLLLNIFLIILNIMFWQKMSGN